MVAPRENLSVTGTLSYKDILINNSLKETSEPLMFG
tara:strand:+ start:1291 stop:1398 length:108 start_codon:yes stop_codon:yes gene_type:complete